MVALAAIAAVVIVAVFKKADTLSVVALSCAVVALLTQIAVFVVQTRSAARRNAEARSLLAEIRSVLAELHALLPELRGRVASAEQLLGKRVDHLTAGFAELDPFTAHPMNVAHLDASDRESRLTRLKSLPAADEAAPLIEKLHGLSPRAKIELSRYGRDLVTCYGEPGGGIPGFPVASPVPQRVRELIDEGLIEELSAKPEWTPIRQQDGKPWFALTDLGREVVRLLVAEGQAPAYLR